MPNDSRPVDLLSDSQGVYGIGIVYDDLIEEKRGCDKHLIFRPDVIAESAFPMENREALLQSLPNHRFMLTYEWKLHEVMLGEALKRNPSGLSLTLSMEWHCAQFTRTNVSPRCADGDSCARAG
jgi:hypothetical protein